MKSMSVDKARRFQSMDEMRTGASKRTSERTCCMARIDAFLKARRLAGLLGRAPGGRRAAACCRMNGDLLPDQVSRPGRGRARELRDGDPEPVPAGAVPQGPRHRLLVRVRERLALPRQPVPPRTRGSARCSARFRATLPTLDSLNLPPIVKKFCDYHQGMVLVTGSTGTGKSTTLAAMIDLLNRTRRVNIVSLEDPIEFVHRSKMAQVDPA